VQLIQGHLALWNSAPGSISRIDRSHRRNRRLKPGELDFNDADLFRPLHRVFHSLSKLLTITKKLVNIKDIKNNRGALVYMKSKITFSVGLLLIGVVCLAAQPRMNNQARSANFETRCGWFTNPTPANAWLYDRDGEWIIGTQGGHQAEGDWPTFKPRQWVHTNGSSYGYGCACLHVRVDKQTREVAEIKSSRARALGQCRQDPALKKWKGM
jgi:Protein of unknown function (DUF4087)